MSRFGPFPDPTGQLAPDEAAHAFATMLDGGGSDEEVAAFLVALSDRGETTVEIAAAAQAIPERREHAQAVPLLVADGGWFRQKIAVEDT